MLSRLLRRSLGVLLALSALLAAGLLYSALMGEEGAAPVTAQGFTVAVDAGHGGFDGGAVGGRGTVEAGLNLAVALLLERELASMGAAVVMTREDEGALGDTKREDMRARGGILAGEGVDVVVSVHMNKFQDSSVSGPRVFYMKGSAEGEALAGAVLKSLCAATGRPQVGPNPSESYYVLKQNACPSIIVECGFLSNPEDEESLGREEYQLALAQGIAQGVFAYMEGSGAGG